MKKIEKQISEIEEELNESPDNPDLLNELGIGYHMLGEYDQAVEYYQKAISEEPQNFKFHFNLANTFYEQKNIDKAVNYYLNALDIKPDYVPA